MADYFLGEIRMFSFSFAPKTWALCNGATLPVNQNQALYALLGNQYGGLAPTNYQLPDLRGRTPVHVSFSDPQFSKVGKAGGSETVTLTAAQAPSHNHMATAANVAGTVTVASNATLANSDVSGVNLYADAGTSLQALAPPSLTESGATGPHDNMQPFLTVNYCIAMQGLFPSRN